MEKVPNPFSRSGDRELGEKSSLVTSLNAPVNCLMAFKNWALEWVGLSSEHPVVAQATKSAGVRRARRRSGRGKAEDEALIGAGPRDDDKLQSLQSECRSLRLRAVPALGLTGSVQSSVMVLFASRTFLEVRLKCSDLVRPDLEGTF
jgi:hypothetical protein